MARVFKVLGIWYKKKIVKSLLPKKENVSLDVNFKELTLKHETLYESCGNTKPNNNASSKHVFYDIWHTGWK